MSDALERAKALNERIDLERVRLASGVANAIVLIWLLAAIGGALVVADHKFAAMDLANQEVAHVAR